jgi:hypothetical protein
MYEIVMAADCLKFTGNLMEIRPAVLDIKSSDNRKEGLTWLSPHAFVTSALWKERQH